MKVVGFESGSSPYALTIPGEPTNVMVRNKPGSAGEWELKWDAAPEQAVASQRHRHV